MVPTRSPRVHAYDSDFGWPCLRSHRGIADSCRLASWTRGWQRVLQLVVRHSYDPRKRNLRHVFLISLNRRLWTPSGSSSLPRKYHPLSSILHATTSTWHSPAAAHRHCPHQPGIYTATSCRSSSDSPTMSLSVPTLTQVTQPWPLRHTHKSLSNLDAGVVVLATGFVSYHCVPESLPTCSLPR